MKILEIREVRKGVSELKVDHEGRIFTIEVYNLNLSGKAETRDMIIRGTVQQQIDNENFNPNELIGLEIE